MGNTELFLYVNGDWNEVDLGETIVIPITYNIADIKDISARNSSFTKTFTLPDTELNRRIFYQIYDVASATTYDLNKKTKAYILRDTIEILYGNFQIREIKSDNDLDFSYECVIYSDTDTLFTNVGEKTLGDLDLSRLDHLYNFNNIFETWTGTQGQTQYSWGYYYPLIDYNNNWDYQSINQVWVPGQLGQGGLTAFNGVGDTFLKPAVYTKVVFDEIINSNGFLYESNFLNSPPFTDLIHPFSTNNLKKSAEFYFNQRIRIGMTGSQNITRNTPITDFAGYDNFMGDVLGNTVSTTPNKIRFNDETPPNGDPSNKYDITTYEYTANNVVLNQRFCINLDFTIDKSFLVPYLGATALGAGGEVFIRLLRSSIPGTTGTASVPGGANINIVNASKHQITVAFGGPFETTVATNLFPWYTLQGGFNRPFYFLTNPSGLYPYPYAPNFGVNIQNLPQNIIPACGPGNLVQDTATFSRFRVQVQSDWLDGTTNEKQPIKQGENVWVEIGMLLNKVVIDTLVIPNSSTGPYPLIINDDNSFFFTEPYPEQPVLLPGQAVDVSSGLPEKLKQKDYLSSIFKMFNLYIEPISENRFRIEPRDDYYNSGATKDWSRKLDISKEIKQQLIADTQAKELLFRYKNDKDYLNTLYFDKYSEVYGERIFDTENEFIKGQKIIEPIFSPTPCRYVPNSPGGAESFVIPYIDAIDTNSKKNNYIGQNLRILTKGAGYTPLPPGVNWTFNSVVLNNYPYAGMLDNPQNPTYTLEFAQSKERYFSQITTTQNDLFNNYWRSQITELYDKDSRIITAYFWLTPQDLYDFKFNDKIFIDKISSGTNNWFRVNKIDYDGTGFNPAKVELVKILDLKLSIKKSGGKTTLPVLVPDLPAPIDKNAGGFSGDWNYSNSNGGLVVGGYFNNIGRDVSGTIVGGNGNEIQIGGKNISVINTYSSFIGPSSSQVSLFNSENIFMNGGENISISNVKGLTMNYGWDNISFNLSKNVILYNDDVDATIIIDNDLEFNGYENFTIQKTKLQGDIDYDGKRPTIYQTYTNFNIPSFDNGSVIKGEIKHQIGYYSGVALSPGPGPQTSNVSWGEYGSVAHHQAFDPVSDIGTYSLLSTFAPDFNRYIWITTYPIPFSLPLNTIVREIYLPPIAPSTTGWAGAIGREYIIKFNDVDPGTATASFGATNYKLRLRAHQPNGTIDGAPFIELDSSCNQTIRVWGLIDGAVFGGGGGDIWAVDYLYNSCLSAPVGPTGGTGSTASEPGRHAIISQYAALSPLRFNAAITSENLVCQAFSSPDNMVLYPFIPDRDMVLTRMIIYVCSTGTAFQQFWLALYDSDSPNAGEEDLPYTRLFLSPNLPYNSFGVNQAVVPNLQLNRGQKYWLALKNNEFGGASSHHLQNSSMMPLGHQLGGLSHWTHINVAGAAGVPAAVLGAVGNLAFGNVPNITLEFI